MRLSRPCCFLNVLCATAYQRSLYPSYSSGHIAEDRRTLVHTFHRNVSTTAICNLIKHTQRAHVGAPLQKICTSLTRKAIAIATNSDFLVLPSSLPTIANPPYWLSLLSWLKGSTTVKVVPSSATLSTVISPPCKSTHCLTIANPSPVP